MKSLIFVAAASAAVGTIPDVLTIEDLEASTREFIETNDIAPYSRRKLGDVNRYSTRSQRLNGGSKSGKGNKGGSSGGKSGKSTGGLWDDDNIQRPGNDVSTLL